MNISAENHSMALARREDLVVQEMPDEILVYDLTRHKAHCLNQTAAFVWNHCDGLTTAAGIAGLMEKEWDKPVGEDVVWIALDQLSNGRFSRLMFRSNCTPQASLRADPHVTSACEHERTLVYELVGAGVSTCAPVVLL